MLKFKIKDLYIYPVKSLGGIAVTQNQSELCGLQHDRRYALVDKEGNFMSQRKFSQMSHFKLEFSQNGFLIKKGENYITIPRQLDTGRKVKIKIWDDQVETIAASDDINDWFTRQLNEKAYLVYKPESEIRQIDEKYKLLGYEQTSLSDGYPILLCSTASLEHISKAYGSQLSMLRFRPNIIIENATAFEEESICRFSINNGEYFGVKACKRCIMVNINPDNKQNNPQVLKTLANENLKDGKAIFGQNVVIHKPGNIAIGDFLKVH